MPPPDREGAVAPGVSIAAPVSPSTSGSASSLCRLASTASTSAAATGIRRECCPLVKSQGFRGGARLIKSRLFRAVGTDQHRAAVLLRISAARIGVDEQIALIVIKPVEKLLEAFWIARGFLHPGGDCRAKTAQRLPAIAAGQSRKRCQPFEEGTALGGVERLDDRHPAAAIPGRRPHAAVPPTVMRSRRKVGWPTPTGTPCPFLPHVPMPGSSFEVVADHGDALERVGAAADDHGALDRCADFSVLELVGLGAVETRTCRW